MKGGEHEQHRFQFLVAFSFQEFSFSCFTGVQLFATLLRDKKRKKKMLEQFFLREEVLLLGQTGDGACLNI